MQKQGPHTGKQKVQQEGMLGLDEVEEEKEVGGMQVGSVELLVSASPGEWEEEWGIRWRR